MIFTSLQYVVFFPIVAVIYFLLPYRFRWLHLLIASCVFYMAFIPAYILILFGIILVDYYTAIAMEKSTRSSVRLLFFLASCTANIGVLCVFKYFNFINANLAALFGLVDLPYHVPMLKWALPIGLSFHVFQSLSYTADVYYGYQPAEKRLGYYALYVMFFPQLVAGPIERPAHLLPQLHAEHNFDFERLKKGGFLILVGLLKKIVVADRLGVLVDTVYQTPSGANGIALLMATFFFAFQIYADFSAYTNIARGSALILGIDLMENFDYPFFSASIREFWRRWHISLSNWLGDYVFVPLCVSIKKPKPWKQYVALLATFFISGLWHGANWTFVLFGLTHGIAYVIETIWERWRQSWENIPFLNRLPEAPHALQVFTTFSICMIGWVFFRSPSLAVASQVFHRIGSSLVHFSFADVESAIAAFPSRIDLVCGIFFILSLLVLEMRDQRVPVSDWIFKQPEFTQWAVGYSLLSLLIIFGRFQAAQFIYFQF